MCVLKGLFGSQLPHGLREGLGIRPVGGTAGAGVALEKVILDVGRLDVGLGTLAIFGRDE